MMKKTFVLLLLCSLMACNKKLDLKPNTGIVLPRSIKEFEAMLDNTEIINTTPALNQISGDEYFIASLKDWQALPQATARNAAIWAKDIYAGENKIADWNRSYAAVFYANNVLELVSGQGADLDSDRRRIRGWAFFVRAYHFYWLVSTFAVAYDPATAGADLGIPLKLSPNVDELVPRSSLQKSYEQIIADCSQAAELLNEGLVAGKKNRPSKVAAQALLARVYLSMRRYELAEAAADRALAGYSRLIDFNILSTTAANAFNFNSEEVIFFSQQNNLYSQITSRASVIYGIDPALIALYEPGDLRLNIYFQKNALGNYNMKPVNSGAIFPFTGLATDELYLIKAECLARKGDASGAMAYLNDLLKMRMRTGTFLAKGAADAADALEQVLAERRKALVWRSLRWTDLKRLNAEGRNIVLRRRLDEQTFSLEPLSPRYALPIPDDEIALSGVAQNPR